MKLIIDGGPRPLTDTFEKPRAHAISKYIPFLDRPSIPRKSVRSKSTIGSRRSVRASAALLRLI
jgi:hypothetical protein